MSNYLPQSDLDKEFVETMLAYYKEMTKKTMLSFILSRGPRRHLYDIILSYLKRGGKGLRPSLCIASCCALNGNIKDVLTSAAVIELFHNASLVHDDITDESKFRSGKPTIFAEHGVGVAINVGDAMNVLSIAPLMKNRENLGSNLTWKVFNEIEHMARESVEGQAIEIGWIRDNTCELTVEDYLRMILKKTCWYTCIHPIRIGALIATEGTCNLDKFNRLGYYMGAAFQIQDDILNLIGDPARYGKERFGDIREGKRTLILIHLLNHSTQAEKTQLKKFLSKPRKSRSIREINWVYELMIKYDSIAYARTVAYQLTGAALYEFSIVFKNVQDSADKQFIKFIISYMVTRDI